MVYPISFDNHFLITLRRLHAIDNSNAINPRSLTRYHIPSRRPSMNGKKMSSDNSSFSWWHYATRSNVCWKLLLFKIFSSRDDCREANWIHCFSGELWVGAAKSKQFSLSKLKLAAAWPEQRSRATCPKASSSRNALSSSRNNKNLSSGWVIVPQSAIASWYTFRVQNLLWCGDLDEVGKKTGKSSATRQTVSGTKDKRFNKFSEYGKDRKIDFHMYLHGNMASLLLTYSTSR